jgi:hypothetical protein
LRPSWQISYKRDFRVLCSIDVSQLIKILLSQGPSPGIAHIRTPFQKSFLPLPRCISAHISQAYCMHAHMHNAYPYPVPPPRIPDSRGTQSATLHRPSVVQSPRCLSYLTLSYFALHLCQPFAHSFFVAQPQPPRHSTQSTFFDPSFNIRLLLALVETSCNGMPDGLHTLRLAALDAERRLPPFCRVLQGRQFSSRKERSGLTIDNCRRKRKKLHFFVQRKGRGVVQLCFITEGWTTLQLRI